MIPKVLAAHSHSPATLVRVYIPCIYILNKIDQISIEVGIFHTHRSCSHARTRSLLVSFFSRNWTSFIVFPMPFRYPLTTSGISMTCWKRCGNTLILSECRPAWVGIDAWKVCTKHPTVSSLSLAIRYTKPKGQLPDYSTPIVLPHGRSTVEDLCNSLHKSIMKEFKQ